ncbi:MAG: biopolymer transporter ExbD [Bacteroidales bacterium]|jgi:biopolymer transport protein ExbD|nr:biopolymer transporter ExbD [Bacteroidales bacterium]
MSRFRKKGGKKLTAISTASLPDVIFMLLFFFMVTTVMRETTLIVKVKVPNATEVQKLERKSLVSYIYIGTPLRSQIYGTESRIQLNDRFATVSDIQNFIIAEREARDEADRGFLTTSLKVDEQVRMGIVTDVKQELRQIGAFRINYSARKRVEQ